MGCITLFINNYVFEPAARARQEKYVKIRFEAREIFQIEQRAVKESSKRNHVKGGKKIRFEPKTKQRKRPPKISLLIAIY